MSLKIKEGFLLKEVAGNHLVVPVGENLVDFSAMVTINDTGVFLWQYLADGTSREELLAHMLAEYDVDKAIAEKDIDEFINILTINKILDGTL